MTQARYRRDYDGEFVILETKFSDGVKTQTREWIPNPIENHHISGRAAVIGSDNDKTRFDYSRLSRHRGGLLGKKRLQTYASGDIWKEMPLDFYVSSNAGTLNQVCDNDYDARATVYSTAKNCIGHAGRLYLIPFSPNIDDAALAIYLAAFDQHQEIFLLGYNQEMPRSSINTMSHVAQIMEQYAGTRFILVGVSANMPDQWLALNNVEVMNHRTFVSYCDV